ncbi:MAG: GxxExxY protein [Kiritimatiellae bacterium]|nr:GxxExxY protein [Kiritimatiellia bacterium]
MHSVHDELGPGINEYCYQEALAMELSDRGIPFEREKAFHPRYKGRPCAKGKLFQIVVSKHQKTLR